MGCCNISKEETVRIDKEKAYQKKKDRFQHEWLFRKGTSFCKQSGYWWAVYVEGEGIYCLLCRKHHSKSQQNKSETFATDASKRFKWTTFTDHAASTKHTTTVSNELLNRVSSFQKQLDEKKKVKNEVLEKAFHAMYWLAYECIANRKITSLLKLLELLGMTELKYFAHRSCGSLREMFITMGEVIRDKISKKLQAEPPSAHYYGLLVDDVADISNEEQMVAFIQYFDEDTGGIECKYLFTANVLQKSDSADAKTMHQVISDELSNLQIKKNNLKGLATDGASVMTGKKNGLAALLKRDPDVSSLVSVHCVCHRLALACTDTNKSLKKISDTELEVTQLWKVFDNSPKKLAAYLKIQQGIKGVILGKKGKKKITKKLKKACSTRWLSFDKAIDAVCKDMPAILQTLRALKQDAACYGLLKKFSKTKKVGVIYILNDVLPILSDLSRQFQQGTINFARIAPSIQRCSDRLLKLLETKSPVTKFQEDLREGGPLELADLVKCTSGDIDYLENLLDNYVSALIDNIATRFQEALPVLNAMQVFDVLSMPKREHPDFHLHGNDHIDIFAKHFFPDDDASKVQLLAEWNALKYDLQSWKLPPSQQNKESPAEWAMQRLCQQKYALRAQFPMMMIVVESLLVIPVSNAWPERGASKLKLIKTRLRSGMKGDMLNALMHISLNGVPATSKAATVFIRECVDRWLTVKSRKKIPKPTSQMSVCSLAGEPQELVCMQSQGTQTACDLTDIEETDEQISIAADKLGLSGYEETLTDNDSESEESD